MDYLKIIAQLAVTGMTRKEIAFTLKQPKLFRNKSHEQAFMQAKIAAKLKPNDTVKKWRDKQRETVPPAPVDSARKASVESQGLEAWLREYFPEWFPLPFSPKHKLLISSIDTRLKSGGLSAIAFPRGSGKTTILKGACIYAVALGLRRYVVPILATGPLAISFLNDIKKQLIGNDWLIKQYPRMCYPATICEDNSQRARVMLFNKQPLNFVWKKNEIILPNYPECRSAGAIIHPASITASMRGLQKSVESTKGNTIILRPDFVLIDDPQTKESAQSPMQTRLREEIIVGDILGLAGPNKQISAFMATTVIMQGDLADRFLDPSIHPDWNGIRVPMISKWPKEQDGLWREYAVIRNKGMIDSDNGQAATEFYRQNLDRMREGSEVTWEERKNDDEIDALQHAENLLIDRGENAFWSEFQNQPHSRDFELYEISPRIVTLRINNMKQRELDPQIKTVVAFTDINYSALHWALVGFRNDRTGFILDYGKIPERGVLVPKNATILTQKKLVAEGLNKFINQMSNIRLERQGQPISIRVVGIDRGYLPDVVQSVARGVRAPFPVLPAKGYASVQYRPDNKNLVGKAGFFCHLSDSQFGQFLASNTDYFKECVQRGFLSSAGSIGSLSLWGKHPERHTEFAEHICGESLVDKAEGTRGMFWKWRQKPAAKNDWLDAVAGCYGVAAWFLGGDDVTQTGVLVPRKRKILPKLRKPKVQIEE